jgi:hypothetical protein
VYRMATLQIYTRSRKARLALDRHDHHGQVPGGGVCLQRINGLEIPSGGKMSYRRLKRQSSSVMTLLPRYATNKIATS